MSKLTSCLTSTDFVTWVDAMGGEDDVIGCAYIVDQNGNVSVQIAAYDRCIEIKSDDLGVSFRASKVDNLGKGTLMV